MAEGVEVVRLVCRQRHGKPEHVGIAVASAHGSPHRTPYQSVVGAPGARHVVDSASSQLD